ncbi:hypothetical protein BDR03DRAFT_988052 [Suillus americanus]|nr:hypothetical protein BDR03DRAFT_988052 [Suillus americanus]
MSSSQHANDTLNLVTKKIDQLVKRSEKLKASDPAAKTLAHEIAATAFAQHGNAATLLAPLLLSCAAKIRDKSGVNGKLKALPDWGTISDEDPRIHTHPLFPKSVGYRHPQPLAPPAVLAELPMPLPPAPLTPAPIQPALAPSPMPPITIVVKANPLAPGIHTRGRCGHQQGRRTCCKESKDPFEEAARSTKVKSKEFITDDEHDEVLADKVIFVKSKTTAVPGTQPAIPEVVKSKATQPADSASEDDASAEDDPSMCLFSVQCKCCIKDNVPCMVILGKKNGEIWKCCHRCDEKKMKCIRPTTEEATILWAVAAKKKAKAANKKAPVNTWAASCIRVPSVDSASEDDASAEDDPSMCLFSVQCKCCIKDNVPCMVILGKKNGEIWKCCHRCDEKKMKCIRPTTEEATILWAVAAKKKAKAANKKTLSPLVDKSTDEDAEGEDVAEPGGFLFLDWDADSQLPEAGMPASNVDNDVNMDFDAQTAVPDLPVSDVLVDAPPNQAVQQPSNLDIIQTIQAMRQEFAGMLQNSGDHAKAINQAINTQVSDLAHNWEERFTAMEKKMREVKLHTVGNMVSIRHMANTMKAFTASGDVSAFQPPPGPSTQRHPFGQIPPSWITQLPPLADDGHLQDPSTSEVGKLFTTAWDESRGPGAGVAGESSASAVESSSPCTGLNAGSQLSSLPSGSSSPKD